MKLKNILGYVWALITIPLAFLIVGSSGAIGKAIFGEDEVKISNRLTGGDVVEVIERNDYSIHLHKLVFDGFFFERGSGFVQIDFVSDNSLPVNIQEEIDYNMDDAPDFNILINTRSNKYKLTPLSEKVKRLTDEEIYVLENRRTIRVEIDK